MARWNPFPFAGDFAFDAYSVRKHWERLHASDLEPLPKDADLLEGWALFHNGEFQKAAEFGLMLGGAGITLANKATCIYATYLELKEKDKLDLYITAGARAKAQADAAPTNPNAWHWQAYALGRYSQGISVAKALAQGLGSKVKDALEKVIELNPKHSDAHVALGAFHAEVIDKVGPLIGGMTYGAKKEVGLSLFKQALVLNPNSPSAMIEYANGLVMLEGDASMSEATALYQQAAAMDAFDAMECLEIELAREELAD
ncbi:MAG: hypothetical protein KAY82_03640 [Hylemonella sp.]|nr:hypothetical protein [Hylemonella sp.]